jgi:CHASE2 domain-containing sensor protein
VTTEGRISQTESAVSGRIGRANLAVGVIVAVIVAAFLVVLERNGLLWEAPDRLTYDWRTYLFSERAPATRDDIVIVRVDEASLTGYPYLSPIDRSLTAEMVRQVADARPAAIGLDFIFDRVTEPPKDEALLVVLKDVNSRVPVIVAAVDERSAARNPAPAYQERLIKDAGLRAGHIYFATEEERLAIGDQAVRYSVPPSSAPPARAAFSQVLAETVGKGFEPASPLIYWRHPPKAAGAHLVPAFTVPPHRDASGKRTGPVLPESWRDALRGKIVLIGGAFTDRDLHQTPLSVATNEFVHGIEIHAQMLAQRLDRRSVFVMSWWQEFLLVAAVAGLGFLAARLWRVSGSGWATSAIAFVVLVGASFGLFAAFSFILPTATLFFAWPAGLLAGQYAGLVTDRAGPAKAAI